MLTLPDSWIWDFWFADTGDAYHVFFLRASKALRDPDRRHLRAGIGHAVSTDLRNWTLLPDALVHSDPPAFDDIATWTGSVLGADGSWYMFYTGVSEVDGMPVQRIGVATSADLITWLPRLDLPPLDADMRWYEPRGAVGWREAAWRDPWVLPDPDGDGWHLLITARANHGADSDRGVVGHARSRDLLHWVVQPPLSEPDGGFHQIEVTQVEQVYGQPVLLFSCRAPELSVARRAAGNTGGVWALRCDSLLGPFDLNKAEQVTGPELYSGRLVQDRHGDWMLLAFHHTGEAGDFRGELSDPLPVGWSPDGHRLVLL